MCLAALAAAKVLRPCTRALVDEIGAQSTPRRNAGSMGGRAALKLTGMMQDLPPGHGADGGDELAGDLHELPPRLAVGSAIEGPPLESLAPRGREAADRLIARPLVNHAACKCPPKAGKGGEERPSLVFNT